ncbi:Universal stress protein UspA-like nucleotide-binding protein [Salinisphaera sp. PC39]|uniref:universal stress protein n=1 Tax=Salinisphaera sp. PC39 TaxID=1304156 RepID=UPI003340D15C
MFDRILFATDGSEASREAGRRVRELALLCHARVIVFLVYEIPDETLELARKSLVEKRYVERLANAESVEGVEILRAAESELREAGIETVPVLQSGRIGPAIVEEAERRGADLIVLGSRGHGAVASLLLGSVTDHVLHNSMRPMLIIPHDGGGETEQPSTPPATDPDTPTG